MGESSKNTINFGDLSHDEKFKQVVTAFHNSTDEIGSHLQKLCESNQYDNLDPEERIEYDLLLAYSINSLFWMYLRTAGIDPTTHDLKGELGRVQAMSIRFKQVKDRKTMPQLDVDAAKRFIKSGLWQPKTREEQEAELKSKHKRFKDDESNGNASKS